MYRFQYYWIIVSKVVFNPRAKIELKKLSKPVKRKVGELLLELEKGKILKMPHSRAMSSVANGVSELRVKDENGIYRVFYYLKVKNKILVKIISNFSGLG